jgi:putative membrane protein
MARPVAGFPWGGLISVIFWALLVSLIVGLLVHLFDKRNTEDENEIEDSDSALEILKKRYAKGEITKKKFLEIKKDVA